MNKYNLFLLLNIIVIINVLVAIGTGYIPVEGVHLLRAYIMILYIIIAHYFIKIRNFTIPIYLFVLYTFVLVFISTDIGVSFSSFLRNVLPFLIFPIAYDLYLGYGNIEVLKKLVVYSMLLCVINIIIAQIFNIGYNPYGEDGIFLGGGTVTQSFLLVFLVLVSPIFFIYKKKILSEWKLLILVILSVLILIAIGRRGATLGLFVGLTIYLIFAHRSFKKILFISVPVLIFYFVADFYFEILQVVYTERRMDQLEDPLQVGRFQEFEWALEWIKEKGIIHAIFGSEIYNYPGLAGGRRQLHNDFAVYLIGAGIIGLLLYFSIFISIISTFRKSIRKINKLKVRRELEAIFYSLISSVMVMSISGLYYAISAMTLFVVLLACVMSQVKKL